MFSFIHFFFSKSKRMICSLNLSTNLTHANDHTLSLKPQFTVNSKLVLKTLVACSLGSLATSSWSSLNPSKYYPTAQVSVYAINLATGKEVINYNSSVMMRPASTLKILTALRTYKQFGPNYQFTTKVWADSKLTSNGTVNGNVTVEFVGDPSINTYTLNQLIKQLKATGIRRINGNLIINVGHFSGHQYPVGWNLSNQGICFSSNVGAAMYNYNCITGSLDPWDKFGRQAKLTYSNQKDVNALSDVVIKPEEYTDSCELNYEIVNQNTFSINGCMIRAKQKLWLHLAVPNGNVFTANTVASRFQENGISFHKMVIDDNKFYSRGKTLLVGYDGYTIGRLLKTMLQDSENHIAETLFQNYAYARTKQPVNYTIAQSVNMAGLKELGFDFPYVQVDGSGLSSYDLISAKGLVAVMSYIYMHKDTMQLYSYFANQNEGTLALHDGLKGFNVVGKTGTIEGSNNFVGVTFNQLNQPIVFTYLINNNVGEDEGDTLVKFEKSLLTELTHSKSTSRSRNYPKDLIPMGDANGQYLAPIGSNPKATPQATPKTSSQLNASLDQTSDNSLSNNNVSADLSADTDSKLVSTPATNTARVPTSPTTNILNTASTQTNSALIASNTANTAKTTNTASQSASKVATSINTTNSNNTNNSNHTNEIKSAATTASHINSSKVSTMADSPAIVTAVQLPPIVVTKKYQLTSPLQLHTDSILSNHDIVIASVPAQANLQAKSKPQSDTANLAVSTAMYSLRPNFSPELVQQIHHLFNQINFSLASGLPINPLILTKPVNFMHTSNTSLLSTDHKHPLNSLTSSHSDQAKATDLFQEKAIKLDLIDLTTQKVFSKTTLPEVKIINLSSQDKN